MDASRLAHPLCLNGVHLLTYKPPPRGHVSSWRQAKWEAAKAFEVDAPTDTISTPENKFFGNFPYPYMNGKLHLGHAFSLSKLEFAAAFHRMQARACLCSLRNSQPACPHMVIGLVDPFLRRRMSRTAMRAVHTDLFHHLPWGIRCPAPAHGTRS
jgi:hypothetical protein